MITERTTERTARRWTAEEDTILREVVTNAGEEPINWVNVSKHLLGRNNKDTRRRWTKIKDDFNRGAWSQEEDNALRRAVEHFGQRWALVTEVVETRSPDQCQKRWRNALDPKICETLWSPEDDQLLLDAVSQMGKNWAQISNQFFPRRSPLSLSNRHAALQQRSTANIAASHETRRGSLHRVPGGTLPKTTTFVPPTPPTEDFETNFTPWLTDGAMITPQSQELSGFQPEEPSCDWFLNCCRPSDVLTNGDIFNSHPSNLHQPNIDASGDSHLTPSEPMSLDGSTTVASNIHAVAAPNSSLNEQDRDKVMENSCMQERRQSSASNILVLENLDEDTRDEILRLIWSRKSRTTLRLG